MSTTQVLAFFDAGFCSSGPTWEATHRADHWAYSLNQRWSHSYQPHPQTPAGSGRYDLCRAEQAAMVVAAARNVGFTGFVLSLLPWNGGYATGAELLAPHCDESFGLAFQWNNPDTADDDARLRRECRAVVAALGSDRHVRLGGRPTLIVRRPSALSDPSSVLKALRQEAETAGLPGLFVIANAAEKTAKLADAGFDALLDPDPAEWMSCDRHLAHDGFALLQAISGNGELSGLSDNLLNYTTFVLSRMNGRMERAGTLPRILPGFCDIADRQDGGAVILKEMTETRIVKEFYGMFVRKAMSLVEAQFDEGKRAVFVDSWNDWRHHSQIEPTEQNGTGLLTQTQEAIVWGHYLARTQTHHLKPRERVADGGLRRRVSGACAALAEKLDQAGIQSTLSKTIVRTDARDQTHG